MTPLNYCPQDLGSATSDRGFSCGRGQWLRTELLPPDFCLFTHFSLVVVQQSRLNDKHPLMWTEQISFKSKLEWKCPLDLESVETKKKPWAERAGPPLCSWVLDSLWSVQVEAQNDQLWILAGEGAEATQMTGRRREKAMKNPTQEGGSKSQTRMEISGKIVLWFSWSKEEVDIFYATMCLGVFPTLQLAVAF